MNLRAAMIVGALAVGLAGCGGATAAVTSTTVKVRVVATVAPTTTEASTATSTTELGESTTTTTLPGSTTTTTVVKVVPGVGPPKCPVDTEPLAINGYWHCQA